MIELVSIHIPKSAGRSLLKILNKVYSEENVLVVNRKNFKVSYEEGLKQLRNSIRPNTKVIHGHIHIEELKELLSENPNAKVITFLRSPVDRVISHFLYEKKILEEKGHLSGFKNVPVDSLLSYAGHPESQNIMHRFLKGFNLKQFYFIGKFENFDAEVNRLGSLLSWPLLEVPMENLNESSKSFMNTVSVSDRDVIRNLNQQDEDIYNSLFQEASHKVKCWVASFPRSGNTYFRNILFYVYGIESGTWHKEKAFNVDKDYDQFPFVKTHLLPNELMPDDPQIPAIYIVRDGRDAMVSIAHHRSDLVLPGSDFLENMQEAIVAAEGSFFGGWSKNVNAWIERATIIIRYEDLIDNPQKVFERIEKVIPLPKADWNNLPTFEQLKAGKPKYGGGTKNPNPKFNPEFFTEKFFRKGKAGGWKEEMPDHLQDLFWNHHGDMMDRIGYATYSNSIPMNPMLDYKAMVKMGYEFPALDPGKIKILIEATKLAQPGNDGIKRYLIHLLKGFEDVKKHGNGKWNFELLIGRKIYPLESYRDVINIEEVEKLHGYEKILLGFKQVVKSALPNHFYESIATFYRKTDTRKLLRLIQQKTSIKQKLAFYEELDSKKQEIDLLHIPLPQNSEHLKTLSHTFLVTVHDVTHKLFPQFHEQANIRLAEEGMNFIVEKKCAVIAVSKCTMIDVAKHYPIPNNLLHLVYEAPDRDIFKWNVNAELTDKVRAKYKLGDAPYFLCLSTIEPRKNLPNTIRAFNKFISDHPNERVNLVVSGNFGWKSEHLSKDLHLDNAQIIFTGYVDDSDLNVLYSDAIALCYLSVYEGFGLPPIEAMSCRTPVIYGNNSSLSEVIGDAGLPAAFDNVNDICDKMRELFFDKSLRNQLAEKAHDRSFEFSWRKSIFETLRVYEEVASNNQSI
jgi:glycosyltransferase involved in cell wall biosynthesis